ncbi:MAG: hypothetical protein II160_05805 [Selenomonas sp.]|nr:hypothetical protein [Selenomonas sp.]
MFQEALSDLFGPGVGLVGFAVMLALFLPKLVKWMRSRRAKREAREAQKPKPMGMRSMQIEPSAAAESIPDHPDHGQALECFKPDRVAILLQILCWILPLAAVLIFVSPGHRSLFAIMLAASIPLALIGLFGLSHLNDHITFYRTGMTGKINGKPLSVDYNAICETNKRSALLPWMAPTYLLHLDDNQIVTIDATAYRCSKKRPAQLMAALAPRIISSAAEETMRKG